MRIVVTEQLRAAIDADRPLICDKLGLRRDGQRYLCPFCQADGQPHNDGDFSIEAGFKCHKCGWSGDGFKLVQDVKSCTFTEAVKIINDIYSAPATTATTPPTASRKDKGGKTIHPTREKAIEAMQWMLNKDGGNWALTRDDVYHDKNGNEFASMLRFDAPESGEKTYRPIHAVSGGWRTGGPKGLRPLFNLPAIMEAPKTELVFVVEGEKACEAGEEIGLTCVTSAGGANAAEKTDWSPVVGRKIVLLPDNDESGFRYAQTVVGLCQKAGASSVKIIHLPGLSRPVVG